MLSRGALYALQAALHLAQQADGEAVSAARMAEALALPPEYLAKVLRRMAADGTVTSSRGARGGYRLAVPASTLTVDQIVAAFEELEPMKVCLLGGDCHADRPCTAHRRRVEWNQAREKILAATRLSDLLPAAGASHERATASLLSNAT